jgi:hypothetical protein
MGSYRFFTAFYACKVGESPAMWEQIERELMELADGLTTPGQTLWGVSRLTAHGLVVRGLSRTGHDLPAGLTACRQTAKRWLYGRDAIVPRKIY